MDDIYKRMLSMAEIAYNSQYLKTLALYDWERSIERNRHIIHTDHQSGLGRQVVKINLVTAINVVGKRKARALQL